MKRSEVTWTQRLIVAAILMFGFHSCVQYLHTIKPPTGLEFTARHVLYACSFLISQELDDPDSAQYLYEDSHLKITKNGTWLAYLPFRARNRFGAMALDEVECEVQHVDGDYFKALWARRVY